MTTMIAPCGLDCAQCDAYRYTQTSDLNALEMLLDKWRVEFNAPEMTIKDVTCDGCLAESGRVGGYCPLCAIRKCALERSLQTCADCNDYACEKLTAFWKNAPEAQSNLEMLRLH